jgi:NAD(P)H-dependent FMN reductase
MSKSKIGIVLSTTRAGRFADKVAAWLLELAAARESLEFELVDLRDYPLPFFDEPMSPAWVPPKNEGAQRWTKKIDTFDGFIFVTAEYNHGIPAVLKNAIDYAYQQFVRKPAAYVGYGGVGAARAIEQLRLINIEQQMAPLKSGVHIGGADFIDLLLHGKSFADKPHLVPGVGAMLDELAWWTRALKQARVETTAVAAGAAA